MPVSESSSYYSSEPKDRNERSGRDSETNPQYRFTEAADAKQRLVRESYEPKDSQWGQGAALSPDEAYKRFKTSFESAIRTEGKEGFAFAKPQFEQAIAAADKIDQAKVKQEYALLSRNAPADRTTRGPVDGTMSLARVNRLEQMQAEYMAPGVARARYAMAFIKTGDPALVAEGERKLNEAIQVRKELTQSPAFIAAITDARRQASMGGSGDARGQDLMGTGGDARGRGSAGTGGDAGGRGAVGTGGDARGRGSLGRDGDAGRRGSLGRDGDAGRPLSSDNFNYNGGTRDRSTESAVFIPNPRAANGDFIPPPPPDLGEYYARRRGAKVPDAPGLPDDPETRRRAEQWFEWGKNRPEHKPAKPYGPLPNVPEKPGGTTGGTGRLNDGRGGKGGEGAGGSDGLPPGSDKAKDKSKDPDYLTWVAGGLAVLAISQLLYKEFRAQRDEVRGTVNGDRVKFTEVASKPDDGAKPELEIKDRKTGDKLKLDQIKDGDFVHEGRRIKASEVDYEFKIPKPEGISAEAWKTQRAEMEARLRGGLDLALRGRGDIAALVQNPIDVAVDPKQKGIELRLKQGGTESKIENITRDGKLEISDSTGVRKLVSAGPNDTVVVKADKAMTQTEAIKLVTDSFGMVPDKNFKAKVAEFSKSISGEELGKRFSEEAKKAGEAGNVQRQEAMKEIADSMNSQKTQTAKEEVRMNLADSFRITGDMLEKTGQPEKGQAYRDAADVIMPRDVANERRRESAVKAEWAAQEQKEKDAAKLAQEEAVKKQQAAEDEAKRAREAEQEKKQGEGAAAKKAQDEKEAADKRAAEEDAASKQRAGEEAAKREREGKPAETAEEAKAREAEVAKQQEADAVKQKEADAIKQNEAEAVKQKEADALKQKEADALKQSEADALKQSEADALKKDAPTDPVARAKEQAEARLRARTDIPEAQRELVAKLEGCVISGDIEGLKKSMREMGTAQLKGVLPVLKQELGKLGITLGYSLTGEGTPQEAVLAKVQLPDEAKTRFLISTDETHTTAVARNEGSGLKEVEDPAARAEALKKLSTTAIEASEKFGGATAEAKPVDATARPPRAAQDGEALARTNEKIGRDGAIERTVSRVGGQVLEQISRDGKLTEETRKAVVEMLEADRRKLEEAKPENAEDGKRLASAKGELTKEIASLRDGKYGEEQRAKLEAKYVEHARAAFGERLAQDGAGGARAGEAGRPGLEHGRTGREGGKSALDHAGKGLPGAAVTLSIFGLVALGAMSAQTQDSPERAKMKTR